MMQGEKMNETGDTFIVGRHSMKPGRGEVGSEEFPGLTEEGVEKARQKAKEIQVLIDEMPENGLFFIVGASYEDRTKSTGAIYGLELQKLYEGNPDITVISKEQLTKQDKALDFIREEIEENQNKKLVVCSPLALKEFDFGHNWGFWSEKGAEYFNYLIEKYGNDEEGAVDEWLNSQDKTSEMFVPDPNKVADQYLKGFQRLQNFAKKELSLDRPLIILSTAHRWDLDAFIVKNCKGEVNKVNFREVIGYPDEEQGLTNENETVFLKISGKKNIIEFRGREYHLEQNNY